MYVCMYVGILGGSKSYASVGARFSSLFTWMGPHGAGVLDRRDVPRPLLSNHRWLPRPSGKGMAIIRSSFSNKIRTRSR